MKLYDVPRGSKLLLPIQGEGKPAENQLCTFNHLDGAYSNITTPDGHTVHLSASADLAKVDDHYILSTPPIKGKEPTHE